jgi:hypothetical protein
MTKRDYRLVVEDGVASASELQAFYDAALREQRKLYGAAFTTVEAVMYSLRERGERALAKPDCQRRLFELNEEQLREVAVRLQKLKPEIAAAWTPKQIKTLIAAWEKLHGR